MEKLQKKRQRQNKKQFKPRSRFRPGDTVHWCPDTDAYYTVLEITDKAEFNIKILKIKSLPSGTEFYVHEDALFQRKSTKLTGGNKHGN